MLEPGSRLGKYRIIRPIGTGGFATVYLGEHVYLKTKAAVKVLQLGPEMDQEEVRKFLHEARTIAALKHPHIVSILDFGVEEGIPCLTMDYAPNGSLGTRHQREERLDLKTVISYTMQIAAALQFAHDHKVIHCDIKPENMLLDQNNNVLLSDFGIAVVLSTNFKMSTVMGTMHYMAPEQFQGKPVPASDQYALAVVIYYWLCGKFPFDGRNPLEISRLQKNVPPLPLSHLNPQISRPVEQVVLKALARDSAQRFHDISSFAAALEKAAAPQRALPPTIPITPQANAQVKKKRNPPSADPALLLPPLTSLLPPLEKENKENIVDQPATSLHEAQSERGTNKLPELQEYDDTQILLAQNNSMKPGDRTKPLPENRAQLPAILSSTLASSDTTTYLTYSQHSSWVSSVAWSPDGKLLASGSWDKTVQIWNPISGKTMRAYHGHTQPVKSVAWSPAGGYIASGGWDNGVQVWDVTRGIALPNVYQHDAQVESIAWSPDGIYIASAGQDGRVCVWRVSNKRTYLIYTGHKGPIWSVAWSPDGMYIASASHDGTVQVWEALTGKQIQVYRKHNHQVAAVGWSYDGQCIASGDHDGWVHIWNSREGDTSQQYHDKVGAVKTLNWSPNSMHLASAVKTVQVWDTAIPLASSPAFTYRGHTNWVNALSWSPGAKQIATASDDKTVKIWTIH